MTVVLNENIYDTAKRILQNKIGLKSKNLIYITSVYENANTSRNPYHIFVANITSQDFENKKIIKYQTNEKILDVSTLLSDVILDKFKSSATIGIIPFVLNYCQNIRKTTNYTLI